ncbi:ABC transporter ATP-binding protein [Clostridium bowmanii]|uniref:ABC transporter ATP-binding protein n=1 Tax=Clostridium bowmanii TaxID=132925 RepID=UPI001C0AAB5D|nr:ABC transporter ATP-binding protein [Clostridium bowmanii]MBU3189537.1 ABC transporter ATP-binding protein [Clostridium bowmanii]MCA1074151.1 ABC transporter ATP-binding protein [Clostridium bowmanii]
MKIILNNISKTYGVQNILDNISLKVEEGALLSILGESGAGKTTILRIIAGLLTPDTGNVIIDDTDITKLIPEKRDIGYVFQSPLLFPHMTIEENICFGLEVKKWDKKRMMERTKKLLKLLQIEELEHRMPSEISGGQQQRVAIARALAPQPKILLMDEPFSSLDPGLRSEMGELIKKIQATEGATIIFVTHDRNESLALSNSIAFIVEGHIAQIDSPQNIYYKPINKTTALYMGECNFIPGKMDGNLFKSVIGSFEAETSASENLELLLRPHQIVFDFSGNDYTIEKCSIRGKEVTYTVSNGKISLQVENFSNQVLKLGQRVGLIFPRNNLHFVQKEEGEYYAKD